MSEIFKSPSRLNTPSHTPSSTTSVNTTILGPNNINKKSEVDCKILNPSFQDESSYEKSVEKGLIRNQVGYLLNLLHLYLAR